MRFLLAAAAFLAALTHAHEVARRQTTTPPRRVVCYYTNWSVYRKGVAKYTPQNINPYLCTHLVYAFGGLTDEFEVKPFDSYQDIEQGGYAKFNGLKQYNKGLKTLLAIGGWNEGSGRFSELVSLPELRKAFIISAIKHLRRYNFDGLDLDWEYPASRDGSAPEDRENYALLVSELRAAFEDEGKKVKAGRLLLTMAVPAGQNYIDKGYDVPSLTRDLDFINILNYDYHSAYEPSVNHHASLMQPPGTSEYAWNAQLNVDWTVKYYIELGADADKLVIGIPTYGRSYTLIDGNFTDFGASADGPGEQGKYTREKGFMAFYEVCENIASHGWSVKKPFPRRIGPYAFSGNQWVGYDDEKIVARKAEYVRENGLGGIMYWSLDNDDFRGICNGEQYPLIEAGKKALFGTEGDVDEALNEARNLQKAPAPAQQVPEPPTKETETRRRRPARPRTRPASRTITTTTTTTTSRPRTRTRTRTRDRNQDTQAPSRTRTREETRQSAPGERIRRPVSLSARLKNRRTTSTTTTTTTTRRPATTASTRRDPSTRRRPGTRRRQGSKRTTTTTIHPLHTPPPPTTPSPVSSFACRREGFFPNPDDCHKYYWCLDSGASGLGIVAHTFTCPSDLVFSKTIDGCDHPTRAKCSTTKRNRGGASATTQGPSTPIPTTTEIPVDYSYLDDYYQDEEDYYYDYYYDEEPPAEESPNTAGRQFQNSGGNQFSEGPTTATEAPETQDTATGARLGGRTRPQYSSISRDRPQTPAPATEDTVSTGRQDVRGSDNARPQYTTITRDRPTSAAEPEQAAQPRESDAPTRERQYTTIERQHPAAQSRPAEQDTDTRQVAPPTEERQYATIERQRPAAQSRPAEQDTEPRQVTPPTEERQYATIERQRPAARPAQQESETRQAAPPTGERQYATIERQRPAARPAQQESETRQEAPATGDRQYSTIERQRPAADRRPTQEESLTEADPATGDLEYVVIERVRPATSSRVTPAADSLFPTEPTLEYVTIQRERPATPATPATEEPFVPEEPEVTSPPVEEVTSSPPRILVPTSRPRVPPTPPRNFFRARVTTTPSPEQPDTLRPESRERPTRPPVTRRPVRPAVEAARTTTPEEEVAVTLPATEIPEVGPSVLPIPVEEEPLPVFPEDVLETTFVPETSDKPSLLSLFTLSPDLPDPTSPAFTTPAPTTPAPTTPSTTTPKTRLRISPRPIRPRVRPSFKPRPTTPQPTTPQPTTTARAPPPRTPKPTLPPRPRAPRPTLAPFSRVPETPAAGGAPASSILDGTDYYDYYYDDLDGVLTGTLGDLASLTDKAVLLPDGSVQCYDTGYFVHPHSCKKFISCSKTVRGLVRGWVYTCPQNLVFDPVGGMCNWAEAVDCQ
ncbi:proteoglycan 4-like isoform X2 [Portunus trituberculatus]|uniref:proteoglycan 4-like isoform X2 n=1 Tax=Portunus trituberculatus TaxID=210409 RepID=UPI001E1CD2B5|nr:proteoglycan 4-like isoform X2 [Portunus trituberculatus]